MEVNKYLFTNTEAQGAGFELRSGQSHVSNDEFITNTEMLTRYKCEKVQDYSEMAIWRNYDTTPFKHYTTNELIATPGNKNFLFSTQTVVNGTFFLAGGLDKFNGNVRMKDTYTLDLSNNNATWVKRGDLNRNKYYGSMIFCEDRLFYLGGYDFGYQAFNEIEEYNFSTNSWSVIKSHTTTGQTQTAEPSGQYSCVYKDGYIYIFGGTSGRGNTISAAKKFNINTLTYENVDSMPIPLIKTFNPVVRDNIAYLFGARNQENRILTIVKYDFINNSYSVIDPGYPATHGVGYYNEEEGVYNMFTVADGANSVLRLNLLTDTFDIVGDIDRNLALSSADSTFYNEKIYVVPGELTIGSENLGKNLYSIDL